MSSRPKLAAMLGKGYERVADLLRRITAQPTLVSEGTAYDDQRHPHAFCVACVTLQ
jgi:hypothetical protein